MKDALLNLIHRHSINVLCVQEQWYNLGLLLRWNLALSSMEKYGTLADDDVFDFIEGWVKKVKKSVRDCAPHLCLLEVCEGLEESNMVGNINTIISLGIKVRQMTRKECMLDDESKGVSYRQLTYDEMKLFHLKMATEVHPPTSFVGTSILSSSGPKWCLSLTAETMRTILATKIMLGQPVKLTDSIDGAKIATVVRIALGATMVIAAVAGDCPYMRVKEATRIELEDIIVVQKMTLLAMYWDDLAATVPSHLPLSVTLTPTLSNTTTNEPELHGMIHL